MLKHRSISGSLKVHKSHEDAQAERVVHASCSLAQSLHVVYANPVDAQMPRCMFVIVFDSFSRSSMTSSHLERVQGDSDCFWRLASRIVVPTASTVFHIISVSSSSLSPLQGLWNLGTPQQALMSWRPVVPESQNLWHGSICALQSHWKMPVQYCYNVAWRGRSAERSRRMKCKRTGCHSDSSGTQVPHSSRTWQSRCHDIKKYAKPPDLCKHIDHGIWENEDHQSAKASKHQGKGSL